MYLCDITGLSVDDRAFEALQTWFDHNDPFYYSALKMRSGGSFASQIAGAYMVADSHNRLKLIEGFTDLFQRFMSKSITEEAWIAETPQGVLCNYKGNTMKITIEIKNQYGQTVAHPICCKAKLFAKIAGTKTLTLETLKAVKALGYEIDQVIPELLKV